MLGRNCWSIGDGDAAFAAFRQASEALAGEPPSVELAAVTAEEARSLLLIAHDSEAAGRSRDAIAIARAVGARAEEGHALTTLGAAVADLGDPDGGIELIREALTIAEELGRPDVLDLAYKILTHVLMNANRLEEAADVVFQGIALDEGLVGVRLNGAGQNSAEALIRLGRWTDADDLLDRMDEHGVSNCLFGPFGVPRCSPCGAANTPRPPTGSTRRPKCRPDWRPSRYAAGSTSCAPTRRSRRADRPTRTRRSSTR